MQGVDPSVLMQTDHAGSTFMRWGHGGDAMSALCHAQKLAELIKKLGGR